MSKALPAFGSKAVGDLEQVAKLFEPTPAGSRILPSQTSKRDPDFQCRLDMGEEFRGNPGIRVIYLQVNSQASSAGLKQWLAKNPHGNLATGLFDMNTPEEDRGTSTQDAESFHDFGDFVDIISCSPQVKSARLLYNALE